MPVRRIPKNYLFLTGRHASQQADEVIEFESILEKEYMLLLDSDPQVEWYEGSPSKFRYLADGSMSLICR
ncbi:hypothetical protein [Ralstonia wenshanensis]|uniref:Uncharacterized protein n=1 Tax=Ralstonia wenshanensis TaxID=2842456 RepID=A0AAD2ETH1_9RALS|nr:hypothetical protein [Ralstonia wenshanensis]CAJ0705061.1 hypothetical protein LMG18091_04339 [Ralstonia wenshanensis]